MNTKADDLIDYLGPFIQWGEMMTPDGSMDERFSVDSLVANIRFFLSEIQIPERPRALFVRLIIDEMERRLTALEHARSKIEFIQEMEEIWTGAWMLVDALNNDQWGCRFDVYEDRRVGDPIGNSAGGK
jgi:hypothetical protein